MASHNYDFSAEQRQAMKRHGVILGEFQNSHGRVIKTYHVLPKTPTPRAVMVFCHGYGHYGIAAMYHYLGMPEKHDVAIYTMDHIGHGFSYGVKAYVKDFANLVTDFCQYVKDVAAKHPGVPLFVVGESMGGAVSIASTYGDGPLTDIVRGLVLVAPMCKIADNLKPPEWQIKMLKGVAKVGPKWPIAPVPDVLERCFKDPAKYAIARADPIPYHGKPRLQTAIQMLYATLAIADNVKNITIPFLLVHGGGDRVTDPTYSKELHEKASSTDKTFNLYDGMDHAMMEEPNNAGERVLNDIMAWVLTRSVPRAADSVAATTPTTTFTTATTATATTSVAPPVSAVSPARTPPRDRKSVV